MESGRNSLKEKNDLNFQNLQVPHIVSSCNTSLSSENKTMFDWNKWQIRGQKHRKNLIVLLFFFLSTGSPVKRRLQTSACLPCVGHLIQPFPFVSLRHSLIHLICFLHSGGNPFSTVRLRPTVTNDRSAPVIWSSSSSSNPIKLLQSLPWSFCSASHHPAATSGPQSRN